MLIKEIADPFTLFAGLAKTQYGLHSFDLWVDKMGNVNLKSHVVPHKDREHGLGAATMNALCRFADQNRKQILLSPTGDGKIIKFYKKFGFKVDGKGMRRKCG